MTRETTEFEVAGHKIVAKTYLTSGEAGEIKKVLFAGVSMEVPEPGQKAEKPRVPLINNFPYERAQLAAVLVSIDGISNPLAVIDEMPDDEATPLIAEIKTALPKVFLAKAKTPDTPIVSSSSSETLPT